MNSNKIIMYQNSQDAASSVLTGKFKTLSRSCETMARGPKLALACFCMALEPRMVSPFFNIVLKKRKGKQPVVCKAWMLGLWPFVETAADPSSPAAPEYCKRRKAQTAKEGVREEVGRQWGEHEKWVREKTQVYKDQQPKGLPKRETERLPAYWQSRRGRI